jgi:hypothetical protein
MHREDNSKYLLYIEPKVNEKLTEPINDELVECMEMALSKSQKGAARYSDINDMGDGFDWNHNGQIRKVPSFSNRSAYKGSHRTECGERSSNCDYLLENGMITNSLAPFYLKWYRYSIPVSEMIKVEMLLEFYKNKNK